MNPFIRNNIVHFNELAQHNALQRPAAAEGHLQLTVFKGTAAEVEQYFIKGFALRFVDGNGPG